MLDYSVTVIYLMLLLNFCRNQKKRTTLSTYTLTLWILESLVAWTIPVISKKKQPHNLPSLCLFHVTSSLLKILTSSSLEVELLMLSLMKTTSLLEQFFLQCSLKANVLRHIVNQTQCSEVWYAFFRRWDRGWHPLWSLDLHSLQLQLAWFSTWSKIWKLLAQVKSILESCSKFAKKLNHSMKLVQQRWLWLLFWEKEG